MKISTRILGLLATAVVGLTLTSCGGGGGGGNGGGGNNNAGSGGNNANTGLAPNSLGGKRLSFVVTPSQGASFTVQYTFNYDGSVSAEKGAFTDVGGTYTYKKNENTATITANLNRGSANSQFFNDTVILDFNTTTTATGTYTSTVRVQGKVTESHASNIVARLY